MGKSHGVWFRVGFALVVGMFAVGCDSSPSGTGESGGPEAVSVAEALCAPVLTCAPLQHVCGCADGAYCVPAGAACFNPTATCPTRGAVLTCSGQQVCRCAGGAYCAPINVACLSPTAACPQACN